MGGEAIGKTLTLQARPLASNSIVNAPQLDANARLQPIIRWRDTTPGSKRKPSGVDTPCLTSRHYFLSLKCPMPQTTIGFHAWVHTLPSDLRKPLPPERAHLDHTSDLYQFVIDSRLLWKLWQIDEYGHYWIEVRRMGITGEPEFHTLVIDERTFDRIECDPYQVEDERPPRRAF